MSRILIVDDEPRILLLMKGLLKANGYEVETAKDGAAALEIVRVGGVDVREYDLDTLRNSVSMVLQKNVLFSGTIRENLQVVDPYLTEERIQEVLQLACVDFIPSLPQGLDTEIGEKGFGLSEGQAQRLAVARAMLLPGKIWILDEITSALDTRTAQQLVRNVMAAGKEKIVLFVTHDPALKACCSQVVDLEKA